MRKALVVFMIVAFTATVAMAAPDPWRVRVSDLDPLQPVRVVTNMCDDEPQVFSILPVAGSWGTGGGLFHTWWADGNNDMYHATNSFNAATGAISFGTDSTVSVAGVGTQSGWGLNHTWNIVKVGAVYKLFNARTTWSGDDLWYSTSADALNFTAPVTITHYGATEMTTSSYGMSVYVSSGGVYFDSHKNSHAMYASQNMSGTGFATSGVGETVWYDIDTSDPVGGANRGDPIHSPDGWRDGQIRGTGDFARVCDGNLMYMYGYDDSPDAPWTPQSPGIAVGTAGELYGGDHYVYVCDPDSDSTIAGMLNSPFSAGSVAGLSGPSLRTDPPAWGNNIFLPMGLQANMHDPSVKFAVLYEAVWDTDSDGSSDDHGFGRGLLEMTRNKADLNFDGTVNFQDIGPFSGAYGSSSGQPLYNPDADFNGDGKVDFQDIGPLSGRYGSDCSYNP